MEKFEKCSILKNTNTTCSGSSDKVEFIYQPLKLLRRDGKNYRLNEIQLCPHCGKMICPDVIIKHFPCNYCHHCGGWIEY